MRVNGTNMMLMMIMYININAAANSSSGSRRNKCKVCLAASIRSIMPSDLAANDPPVSSKKQTEKKKMPPGRKMQSGGERQQGGGGVGAWRGGGLEMGLDCVQGAVGSNPTKWKEIGGLGTQQ